MTTWSTAELDRIEGRAELQIASYRPDGTLRPYVTIWFVRSGDDLYVRSAYGPKNGWYVRAKASGSGRIRIGSTEHDVTFEASADPGLAEQLHRAYHAKYDRYGPAIVGTVVSDEAARTTLRVVPA